MFKFNYNGMLRVLKPSTVTKFHSESTGQWILNGYDVMRMQYRSFFIRKINAENPEIVDPAIAPEV